ncbi:MAG: methionine adenosyltransferase [Burkholderiales bacterium]|nr:methionine adenosyltransferase [Burkholderiales bacterium]
MLFCDGLFTSESVSDGHPDKFCDQISDAVLDACLEIDPGARVAVETAAKGHRVWVFGEITALAVPEVSELVRDVARGIGHGEGRWGLDPNHLVVNVDLELQSKQIAVKVDTGGAGDQGLMFGYACDETPEFLPAPIAWANALMRRHKTLRLGDAGGWLGPDAKSQVTVEYAEGRPLRIQTVVLSVQHPAGYDEARLREFCVEQIIRPVLPQALTDNAVLLINPGGSFVDGGPIADAGLTGRKIIVDTYGGYARHGGGAFSGKDPTKVDRSAAYAARHLAREIVCRGAARHCEVRLAYAIGVADPVAISVETFGTGGVLPSDLVEIVSNTSLFTPAAISSRLCLRQPIYRKTAAFGHFGRLEFPWEQDWSAQGGHQS